MKTIVTLKLFSTFLGWIPMKSSYTDSDSFSKDLPQTYSSLISKVKNGLDSNGHAGSIEIDRKNAKSNLNAIAAAANDWIVGGVNGHVRQKLGIARKDGRKGRINIKASVT